MFVAQELRKTNIAEYLLYMWQIEDTIRAFDCSLSRIRREYIDRFDEILKRKAELSAPCGRYPGDRKDPIFF